MRRKRLTLEEGKQLLATGKARFPGQANQARTNKYNAHGITIDGIQFDSKIEGTRYEQLRTLQRKGLITALVPSKTVPKQVFTFEHNGVVIGKYTPDFLYHTDDGRLVVEDVKSAATKRARDWPLRRKLMQAFYKINVVCVDAATIERTERRIACL